MKTLTYPQINNIDLWDKIVSHKHQRVKEKLLPLREKVNLRYAFYEEHFDSLDEILPLPFGEWRDAKDELIDCYGNNVEFKKIRHQLFSSLSMTYQTKCPYCMLNRPNTLEHYFDKAHYPEFSVYIPNLVPCCSECNTDKDKKAPLFDERGKRNYIHFYHDQIPTEQFLFVRFVYSGPDRIPVINITLKFSKDNYISELIQKHFSNLSLLSKYQRTISERLAPILEEIQEFQQCGSLAENIKDSLQIKLRSLAKHYGNNYWETCLYEGILNSPEFLSQLLLA